jgi:glycerol-3-phosphate O-acyltransferase
MVLFRHALSAPLIAAGDNLSFWPLGPILRRGGAFFIRRSFKGKKLYPVLVDAYMRRLIVEGFPLEFFVEGGRSRTGKLLAPKFGLLTMVVDAALKLRMKKVFFVPVSIGYERIIEERSYVHELGGGEKQKENVGGLLKTSEVLRSKYGRLYVQFGKVLAFDDVLKWTLGEERAESRDEITPSQRRALVQRVGHRVTYQIDRVTVVTPAALVASALLVHQRRGIARSALIERAVMLLEALRRQGARVADALVAEDGVTLREDTLDQALGLFYDAKLVREAEATGGEAIYRVSDQRRLALEYYKNNLLHFFVPSALISAALLRGEGTLSLAELRERVRWLSRLFKYEFMYRADAPFERIFDEAVATMIEAGEIEREGGIVGSAGSAADGPSKSAGSAADGPVGSAGSAADDAGDDAATMRVGRGEPGRHLEVYAVMLGSYLEAYHLAARAAESLDEGGTDRKSWLKKTLSLGQRMYLAGEIEHREAISKDKLEGALSSLKDLQVVKLGPENAVARGAEPASTVLEPLARYLR